MDDKGLARDKLRRQMKRRREQLSASQVQEFSHLIMHKLAELEPVKRARSIMYYAAINHEVDLGPLIEREYLSRHVLLPRIEANGLMAAVQYTGWSRTHESRFGILEPEGAAYPVENIDVVIVPGLVFDFNGYRLGYGKGYYDRFLARLSPRTFICGVGYEFQIIDNIFPHEKDLPVHWIVTEKSELVIDWNYF
ncbi:MAG: 5-formyltetrahydrofolate cyclo-ligase [Syntrophomonadaceae bacterium]